MQGRIIDCLKTKHPVIQGFCSVFDEFEVSGIEQSVKIGGDSILKDRVVIGIPTHRMSYDQLWNILQGFNFPEEHKEKLDAYYLASLAGFALEIDGDKLNHRVYFEKRIFTEHLPFYAMNDVEEVGTIVSVKWDYANPEQCNLTNYYLRIKNVEPFDVEKLVRESEFNYTPKFVRQFFKKRQKFFLYRSVDLNTERKAFYIKPRSDIYLKDVRDDIFHLSNSGIYDKLSEFDGFKVSNFGGGVSKDGKKFYNLYFTMYLENDT